MYTARRLLLSSHGKSTPNRSCPPWIYTTLIHMSDTSSTSTHQRQSLSTQWKVSSLAHASWQRLLWRCSLNTLIWPWSRHSALAWKQVLWTFAFTWLQARWNLPVLVNIMMIAVSSSVPPWLVGLWGKLLRCEKDGSDLEWCPAQLQTPGSWKSPGRSEDARRSALHLFTPAEPQQPAAAVDWTEWPAGSFITATYTLTSGTGEKETFLFFSKSYKIITL